MALNLKINGSNFISEKRKAAYEQALAAESVVHSPILEPALTSPSTEPALPAKSTPSAPVIIDYSNLLSSLEKGLSMSFDHQEDTLHVHEQYLRNQAESAAIFSQLMEQQSKLFSQSASAPTETLTTVLQTISRSIEQFHTHQGDTLSVHNTFLQQQAEYSREFVGLLRQQYDGATGQSVPAAHVVETTQPIIAPPVSLPEPAELIAAPAVIVRKEPVQVSVSSSTNVDIAAVKASLLDIVSEKTGYPVDMLELDMDMEADLGIDSIKRVEILGALQDAFPALPEIDSDALVELRSLAQIIGYLEGAANSAPAPVDVITEAPSTPPAVIPAVTVPVAEPIPSSPVDVDADHLQQALLDIVSEKTGYPADMLELDMDMEADLGIDSIKRVEILGAMQDAFPALPELGADELAELRTLGQIKEALNSPVEVALKKA